MATRHRVAVLHGVNLDQLGRRDPDHYGGLSFRDLERRVDVWCRELGFQARFFQTNHEGAFVEYLHRAEGLVDAILINPGAWTHYAWSIRDALEIAGLPAVEVHLSDVGKREPWRHHSVISSLCVKTITGKGPEGYREGLEVLLEHLGPLDALGTASASENEEEAIAEEGTAADAQDGAEAVVAAAEEAEAPAAGPVAADTDAPND